MEDEIDHSNAKPRARRLKWIGWVALGCFGLGAICAYVDSQRDRFSVGGVPFVLWVAQRADLAIQDPIASIGTNAIPSLIRILNRPPESAASSRVKTWVWN